jgi:hypothetical protein
MNLNVIFASLFYASMLKDIVTQYEYLFFGALKVPKCENFYPFFFTPINPILVGDLRTGEKKIKNSKTTADIRHFVFFTQAEPALKICLRRLSLR